MGEVWKEWQTRAMELHEKGASSRYIAREVGKGKSTINDFLARKRLEGYRSVYNPSVIPTQGSTVFNAPKVLLIDIETAPLRAHVWSMWQHGVGLNQIEADWFILSYAAKWLGKDEVFYEDQRGKGTAGMEEDYELLESLWSLLNEADIIIAHNGRRFDVKKINARLILNGFPKPSTFRVIDTLEIVKQQFAFTSNKLEYLTDKLCTHKKSKHTKFPGHNLWVECLADNPEAWEEMEEYNKDDIFSLEELYNLLSSWDSKLPNFDVYVDDVLDMEEWEEDGYHYTNLGKYRRYRHKTTGIQRRSRVNELSKEKRKSLLVNIL